MAHFYFFFKVKDGVPFPPESDAQQAQLSPHRRLNNVGQVKNLIEGNIHYRDGTAAWPRKNH